MVLRWFHKRPSPDDQLFVGETTTYYYSIKDTHITFDLHDAAKSHRSPLTV